ncbi:MAG: transaldolase [Candidatus Eisenbacteria bacterium]|nr:transaldolase [Candidatus Eisenbacteria bacterium]
MKVSLLPGPIEREFRTRLRALENDRFAERLRKKEPGLWSSDASVRRAIANRLGWLDLFDDMEEEAESVLRFAGDARREFQSVLLLGMGGSSLAPEVLARTFGRRREGVPLLVLDSTHPEAVREAEEALDLRRTLVVVASKSGTTVEADAFRRFFASRIKDPRCFVAITDAGSPLDRLASEEGWRRVFRNPLDIGGRFSALSLFGLVPASLLGLDPRLLLRSGREAAMVCAAPAGGEENPGLALGAFLAEGALAGRDKLTLLVSPELPGFGAWIEQLVAESTGKEGKGILPVDGEPAAPPDAYGDDRMFAIVRCEEAEDRLEESGRALAAAGHPVATIRIPRSIDLGGAFYLWEVATACACSILGVNAFDEPNVSESKERTGALLSEFARTGRLEEGAVRFEDGKALLFSDTNLEAPNVSSVNEWLRAHLSRARDGDYLALLFFLSSSLAGSKPAADLRAALRERTGLAVSAGIGPRYLHSTGQLFKGGPNRGVFVLLTAADSGDLSIPGLPYSFGVLCRAQAAGDFGALAAHGRRVLRVHFKSDPEVGIGSLARGAVG